MSESATETGILNSIPDFKDGGGSDVGGGAGDGGGDSGAGHSSAPATSAPAPGGGDAGGSSAPAQAPQQPGAVQRRHDGLLEVPNQQNPNTRDLVDPVTGRVVAQGGIERRVYEEGQRHARENAQLKQQLNAAVSQVQNGHAILQEAQRFNITPEQHTVALRVMADFVRDPVRTLEYMVNEVRAKGYQIPWLTQGMSPGMDLEALSRLVDNKLAPFTQQQQAAVQQQRANAQAKQQIDEFLNENPAAQQHLDVLGEMLKAQPGLSLDRAWGLLLQWAVENGYDFRRPIEAQRQQPTQQPAPQQTRPLPGSRSAGNGAVPRADASGQFSETTSWSDIIRSAMHESGYAH